MFRENEIFFFYSLAPFVTLKFSPKIKLNANVKFLQFKKKKHLSNQSIVLNGGDLSERI